MRFEAGSINHGKLLPMMPHTAPQPTPCHIGIHSIEGMCYKTNKSVPLTFQRFYHPHLPSSVNQYRCSMWVHLTPTFSKSGENLIVDESIQKLWQKCPFDLFRREEWWNLRNDVNHVSIMTQNLLNFPMQLHWIDTHSYSYPNSYLVLEKGSRLERLQISQFKQIQAMSGAKAPLTSSPTKCVQLNAK